MSTRPGGHPGAELLPLTGRALQLFTAVDLEFHAVACEASPNQLLQASGQAASGAHLDLMNE